MNANDKQTLKSIVENLHCTLFHLRAQQEHKEQHFEALHKSWVEKATKSEIDYSVEIRSLKARKNVAKREMWELKDRANELEKSIADLEKMLAE